MQQNTTTKENRISWLWNWG